MTGGSGPGTRAPIRPMRDSTPTGREKMPEASFATFHIHPEQLESLITNEDDQRRQIALVRSSDDCRARRHAVVSLLPTW